MSTPKVVRCAIYTRKSSEEGLEQDFNSLHAQREACEAYIKSQRHEGWALSPAHYEDGGYSGGNMDRPGIRKLLTDVASGKVQVAVVYKVDRLTRSLADFARIVETLDRYGASFVSVTQQFNTTSSMGRLTLNVLLSFAQFEREVTGERIRDKIAASKKKGLWMGGAVPLGYAPKDRTLIIVPEDAERVRWIFKHYVKLGSVNRLAAELKAAGITTKQRTSKRSRQSGGVSYTPGALYHLLRNPIYRGEIRHKGTIYPGQHGAIIDQPLWERVQDRLRTGARRPRDVAAAGSAAPLSGKLFDTSGYRMTPVHTRKADGRRYRAYVSQAVVRKLSLDGVQITRISAGVIEPLVLDALARHPGTPDLQAVRRVVVGRDLVRIEVEEGNPKTRVPLVIDVPVHLCQRGREKQIRPAGGVGIPTRLQPDPTLVRAMIRAYHWRAQLETGVVKSIGDLSRAEQVNATYVARLLPLAFLAPDLTEAILDGRQSPQCSLTKLRSTRIPLEWDAQRALLGGSTAK